MIQIYRQSAFLSIFLSYSQHAKPDQRLAHYLNRFLGDHGHEVFIDAGLRLGEAWLDELDRWLRASDFLVVLLSRESADSEMIQAEVQRAYQYRKRYGHPHALPVRIAYEGMLPHSIDWFLNAVQYAIWRSEGDDERVGREVLAAIEGRLEDREPVQIRPLANGFVLSEDGRPVAADDSLTKPLPEVDPRFLEELEAPGGAVKLRDRFYVERVADVRLRSEIVKAGTTTTIRAARQTGKTSLLVRGAHHARERGFRIVRLDLQRMDDNRLESPDLFLRDLGEFIVRKVRLNVEEVDKVWRGSLGPQVKLTDLLEAYVLPEADAPIVLALDEADRLLQTGYYQGFFAMIRSWHNSRADDDLWNRLNIVLVISTEPYLLIPDLSQSPFNVGLNLYLKDFTPEQVRRLNRLHGYPVKSDQDFAQVESLNRVNRFPLKCDNGRKGRHNQHRVQARDKNTEHKHQRDGQPKPALLPDDIIGRGLGYLAEKGQAALHDGQGQHNGREINQGEFEKKLPHNLAA